jgi:hypothetical protein
MIRLPDHVSKADKMARIEEIVDALHLRKCLDTSKESKPQGLVFRIVENLKKK